MVYWMDGQELAIPLVNACPCPAVGKSVYTKRDKQTGLRMKITPVKYLKKGVNLMVQKELPKKKQPESKEKEKPAPKKKKAESKEKEKPASKKKKPTPEKKKAAIQRQSERQKKVEVHSGATKK